MNTSQGMKDYDAKLYTAEEAQRRIRGILDRRDHWVLIPLDSRGLDAIAEIEKSHYVGKASKDFELAMYGPAPGLGLLSLFFAAKCSLDGAQLAKIVGVDADRLEDQDILCLGRDGSVAARVIAWLVQEFDVDTTDARN